MLLFLPKLNTFYRRKQSRSGRFLPAGDKNARERGFFEFFLFKNTTTPTAESVSTDRCEVNVYNNELTSNLAHRSTTRTRIKSRVIDPLARWCTCCVLLFCGNCGLNGFFVDESILMRWEFPGWKVSGFGSSRVGLMCWIVGCVKCGVLLMVGNWGVMCKWFDVLYICTSSVKYVLFF